MDADDAARMSTMFVVARNPEPASTLPYLLRLPIEGGLVLKAREPWPSSRRCPNSANEPDGRVE